MTPGQEMNRTSQFRDMASSPFPLRLDTFSQRRQLPILCLLFANRTQINVALRYCLFPFIDGTLVMSLSEGNKPK